MNRHQGAAVCASVLCCASAFAQSFTIIDATGKSIPYISADGSVIAATQWIGGHTCCRSQAVRWTQAGGWKVLGQIEWPLRSLTSALSADGSQVLGLVLPGDGNPGALDGASQQVAFLWREETGLVIDDSIPSGWPLLMSADGKLIVGGHNSAPATWTVETGLQEIAGLTDDALWYSHALSADGSTLVASTWDFDYPPGGCLERATIWRQETGAVEFGLPGSCWSATACSADGSVVFGGRALPDASGWETYRWTADTGFEWIATQFDVHAVSADGLTAVGSEYSTGQATGMLWHPAVGAVRLDDYLESFGVDLQGWTLSQPNSITPDGRKIVGSGGIPSSSGGIFVVVVPPFAECPADLNADRMVDDADFPGFVESYQRAVCDSPLAGCTGDFNRDGAIDDRDFVVFVRAYEQLVCAL